MRYRQLLPVRVKSLKRWQIASNVLVACCFFILLTVGCRSDSGATWRRIQQKGVLRVGLDPTYPPFETADGGELRGIDVDIARALGAELDLDVEFVYFGFDGLYDALATEQVDVLISALVIRPDQTKDFAYSEPYFNAGQILIRTGEQTGINAMSDLNGHSLAVELGAQGHVIATEWERRLPELTIQPYDTPEEALNAVRDGEVDAALIDTISGRLYLAQHDELSAADEPVTAEPFVMVVRKEDDVLLQELNQALDQLKESRQLDAIIDQWMATSESS